MPNPMVYPDNAFKSPEITLILILAVRLFVQYLLTAWYISYVVAGWDRGVPDAA